MDKGYRAWRKAQTENRVNVENCIAHQKEIDTHPKFWESITAEKIAILNEKLKICEKRVKTYTGKLTLTKIEADILAKAQRFIAVATAAS